MAPRLDGQGLVEVIGGALLVVAGVDQGLDGVGVSQGPESQGFEEKKLQLSYHQHDYQKGVVGAGATYSLFGRDRLEGCAACKRAPVLPFTGPLGFEVLAVDRILIQCLLVVAEPRCKCEPGARLVGQRRGPRT